MRVARWSAVVIGWAMLAAPAAWGQRAGGCMVQLDSMGGTGRHIEVTPGVMRQFGGGGVWASCRNQQTAMYADSVAWYSDLDRVDFIGSVRFRDSSVTMNARRASYFVKPERWEAYGDVHLVNRISGSQLDGPNLIYWREAPGVRDTTELYATDRPTVRYRTEVDTTDAEPYVIVGNRVRLRGAGQAWAGGNVTIDRSDLRAVADSAALDADHDRGFFVGHAEVEGKASRAFTLRGRRIAYRLSDDRLSWVQAQELAHASSEEWQLAADTIEFTVMDDLIQQGTAWGDTGQSRVISATYTMEAESLAIDSPNQDLREIRGYGRALATSRADSLAPEPDWVAGDSLVARFDTTASGGRMMTELEARGAARAYYRVYEEDGRTLAGINYSRGHRILARFSATGIDQVDVVGAADGVYLEPAVRRPP